MTIATAIPVASLSERLNIETDDGIIDNFYISCNKIIATNIEA